MKYVLSILISILMLSFSGVALADFELKEVISEMQSQTDGAQYSRTQNYSWWASEDPNDLAPIKGSVWSFVYTTLTGTYTNTLTFGDTIKTAPYGDYDNAVALTCTNEHGQKGGVTFVEISQGELGFMVGIVASDVTPMYSFTISNNMAIGKYVQKDNITGEFSDFYDLVGIRTGDGYYTQSDLNAQYEAGKQYCIDNPAACGIEIGATTPPFIGVLPDSAQTYLTLTDNSVPFYSPPGSFIQVYGSQSSNTMNVRKQSRMQFNNAVGANEINLEEASTEFTIYRSGATIYLESTAGTRVKIAATITPQTLCFADGSSDLSITGGNIYLGPQMVTQSPLAFAPADENNTSGGLF